MIEQILGGKSAALISDAGTPLISDPGFLLVKLAHQNAIPVIPIPGPCALITALCAAGVPCDSFLFLGFLPAKQQARKVKLESLRAEPHTLIFTNQLIALLIVSMTLAISMVKNVILF